MPSHSMCARSSLPVLTLHCEEQMVDTGAEMTVTMSCAGCSGEEEVCINSRPTFQGLLGGTAADFAYPRVLLLKLGATSDCNFSSSLLDLYRLTMTFCGAA